MRIKLKAERGKIQKDSEIAERVAIVKLGARIKHFRKARKLTMAELSEMIDVSQPAISQWETGKDCPSSHMMVKLLKALKITTDELFDEAPLTSNVEGGPGQASQIPLMPVDVPVYGTAVGGSEGDFSFNGQVSDYVRRPPGVLKLKNMYALWVVGDSMAPWNKKGDLIYITPARTPVVGDYVVVELSGAAENEPGVAMVKLLTGKTATQLKLKQYNPAREFTVPLSNVKAMHKVLSLRDLLGV
jgi:phage repressor protein C with HTH and peptisase S24 domain